jgi:hypothetical protein
MLQMVQMMNVLFNFLKAYMYWHIGDVFLNFVGWESRISHYNLLILQHGTQGYLCIVRQHSFFAARTGYTEWFLTKIQKALNLSRVECQLFTFY